MYLIILNRGFISLNSVNQLIFVMVKCGVLFEVRTEFLNIIYELRLQRVNTRNFMSYYIINEPMPEEKSFRLCQGSNLDRPVVQFVVRHCVDWATRHPYLMIPFHNSLRETEENYWRPLSTQPEFQSGLEQARSHIAAAMLTCSAVATNGKLNLVIQIGQCGMRV
jgi:hypothetical protein